MDEVIQAILGEEGSEKIAELSASELREVKAKLQSMGVALHSSLSDSDNPEDDAEALEAIADRIEAIDEKLSTIEAEETARAERLAATMERIGATDEEAEEASDEDDAVELSDEGATEEAAEVVEEDAPADEEADVESTEEAPEPVVAAAPKVSDSTRARLATINKAKPAAAKPAPKDAAPKYQSSLVAGGAVEVGPDRFSTANELAEAFIDVHKRVSGIAKQVGRQQVAKLNVERPIVLGDDAIDNTLKVSKMQRELERGNQDALTASGGFCAPAETVYDFFDISSRDGLLVLPTVTARRGRVQIPTSPSIGDIIGDTTGGTWGEAVASEWTNANDTTPGSDGPATKPCFHIECANFGTFEVAARVLCLTFGNFQQQFYPELVADTLGKSLVAHDHLVNAGIIADIVALADSTGPIPSPGGGALSAVLGTLAFKAAQYRERYRMARGSVLTAVLPHWVRDAMVADYVRRASTTDPSFAVGAIESYFRERNINPQFVYDWQNIGDAAGPAVEFPASADILLYAEGTIVRLDAPSLDFGVTRDSTLNSTNDWQQFVEQFVGVAKVGHEVMLIENVETCPSGETGQAIDLSCLGS